MAASPISRAAREDNSATRLTGNQPLHGAPEGLIVGDSHIVANSLRDQDAMGANPFVYFQF